MNDEQLVPTPSNSTSGVSTTRRGEKFTNPEDVQLHSADFKFDDWAHHVESQCDEFFPKVTTTTTATIDGDDGTAWESHYQKTQQNFYPIKNYVFRAFPSVLMMKHPGQQSNGKFLMLDLGCGTGSCVMPIMRQRKEDVYICVDVSATAVRLLSQHDVVRALPEGHFHAGVVNLREPKQMVATLKTLLSRAEDTTKKNGGSVDSVLCLFSFVLCALGRRGDRLAALCALADWMRAAATLLAIPPTCCVVCFRDYGMYDHGHLRFAKEPAKNVELEPRSFCKGDGTQQHYFELEDTRALFLEAGFGETEEQPLEYHCNLVQNRKTGVAMHKVFVNGCFRLL
eukprot:PhM_4_TR6039/c0_g1_i1/m.41318/K00599/METTL6; methyltransferase-like protein 6